MTEIPGEFAVHRFVQELFEDLTLTLPSLGCAFDGVVTPNGLTVKGSAHWLKNKIFLLFADLATGKKTLSVRFQPTLRGVEIELGFACVPFDPGTAVGLPGWDPALFSLLSPNQGTGFRVTLPEGQPLDAGPPVNWSLLDQLYGGAETGARVLAQFVTRSQTLMAEIGQAIATADAPGLLRTAHTLKGSARGVTANPLAEAALQLEMVGRAGALDEAPDLYKALGETYDEFMGWVRQGRK